MSTRSYEGKSGQQRVKIFFYVENTCLQDIIKIKDEQFNSS